VEGEKEKVNDKYYVCIVFIKLEDIKHQRKPIIVRETFTPLSSLNNIVDFLKHLEACINDGYYVSEMKVVAH